MRKEPIGSTFRFLHQKKMNPLGHIFDNKEMNPLGHLFDNKEMNPQGHSSDNKKMNLQGHIFYNKTGTQRVIFNISKRFIRKRESYCKSEATNTSVISQRESTTT